MARVRVWLFIFMGACQLSSPDCDQAPSQGDGCDSDQACEEAFPPNIYAPCISKHVCRQGACTAEYFPPGTPCYRGCQQDGVCQGSEGCHPEEEQAPFEPCSPIEFPHDACNSTRVCNHLEDQCDSMPLEGAACDDGDENTTNDRCEEGQCVSDAP